LQLALQLGPGGAQVAAQPKAASVAAASVLCSVKCALQETSAEHCACALSPGSAR
jgi:hypothetical protein